MTDQPTAAPHPCIVEQRGDVSARVPMLLIRCRCHMNNYLSWRVGDPVKTCPTSGALISPQPEGSE